MSLLFFNSSIVESSKPMLVAMTSLSAKLVPKFDTKIIDKTSVNEKTKTG
ncbi:MAG: hypothetical protein O2864_02675 [Crenarchaeota archaeon]|nr:hypothetical protein [Thermoproteota archaeon]